MRLYSIGHPSSHGGARTELWHTIKLWRRFGVEVTVIPTWSTNTEWRTRLADIGCEVLDLKPKELFLPDDSLIVSFCNGPFIACSRQLRNCRLIYVRCMNYWDDPLDRQTIERDGPFNAYVCQSEYQRRLLWPRLHAAGVTEDQCPIIRGAFDLDSYPFRPKPHRNGDPFVIGRLSSCDRRKYPDNLWEIYGRIPGIKARVMGWDRSRVEQYIGKPPDFAEVLSQCGENADEFVRSLHCMVHPMGSATENWPRVVLEAMAVGTPVVTDRRGGVVEMIEHERTGYLCQSTEDFVNYTTMLSENEPIRMDIASRARTAIEEELADPETIWAAWAKLFVSVMQGD